MKMKKGLTLASLLVLTTVLGACGSKAADAPASKAPEATKAPEASKTVEATKAPDTKKLYIPVISKGFQHQFWQAVKLGAEKAAKEFQVDITFEGPESETQVDKQLEMLQTALGKSPAAIAFAALDSKAATTYLEKAKAANIPIVGFDSGVDSSIPVTTAATDNRAAAALAADKMAELIGGEGEIGMIVHDQTSRTGIDRGEGFANRIKEKYPKIKIVDTQYSGDHLKATDLAKAIIQAHPNIKGFFGSNEGAAIGVLNAVTELKKDGKIKVIGYDSGKQQQEAIRSGKMAGAITQDPIGIGYWAVKAAVQAKKGESVPKNIDTGFHWYDKTNIDSPDIKVLLYN
ncbi:substrate-binding domain-containing protein [Paenibacillus radicibacter]|uniref:substrate-binding domain-containing protein n=1 Tax=Paenibacillus radicibacter TaxID=2972488 RepID=UPI00358E7C07